MKNLCCEKRYSAKDDTAPLASTVVILPHESLPVDQNQNENN